MFKKWYIHMLFCYTSCVEVLSQCQRHGYNYFHQGSKISENIFYIFKLQHACMVPFTSVADYGIFQLLRVLELTMQVMKNMVMCQLCGTLS